jgi:hypothetical protein
MNYAHKLYVSQGFEPWGTYDPKNGTTPKYLAFMPGGKSFNASGSAGNSGTNITSGSTPSGTGGIVSSIQQSVTNFAQEAGVFILALLIIALGVMLLSGKQIGDFVHA